MELTPVETEALECARDLVSKTRFGTLPVDIERLASHLGVTEIAARDMPSDGYLGRDKNGEYVIRYRAVNSPRRNRFTIAHEVGHLLLLKLAGENVKQTQKDVDREERVVNRIASELLMPEPLMEAQLAACSETKDSIGWGVLARLAGRFDVSLAAIAIRMLELSQYISVSLSIGIEGPGPSRPIRFSQSRNMHLVNGLDFETDRIWRDSRRTHRHALLVSIDRKDRSIACEGRVHTLGRGIRQVRQYWVIGWVDPDTH